MGIGGGARSVRGWEDWGKRGANAALMWLGVIDSVWLRKGSFLSFLLRPRNTPTCPPTQPRGEADQDPDDDDDNENSSGGSGVPLFGNGGDGKYEKALARLAASVHAGGPQEYGRAMLDALGSLAARAGLMRKPGAADKDDDGSGYGGCGGDGGSGEADGDGEGGGVAEPCQWLQLLQYAALLLRALPTKRVVGAGRARGWDVEGAAMTLRGVREALLLLGVRHPVAAVRCVQGLGRGCGCGVGLVIVGLRRAHAGVVGRVPGSCRLLLEART